MAEAQDCSADLELARLAASGDESAWRRIFDRTSDRLYAILCYQVGNREEALDLLQETYLRAFVRLRNYRGDAPLETWLRTISLRKAIDWKRTFLRRWRRSVELSETSAKVDPPSTEIHGDRERRSLHSALASLSSAQRAVLLLREWEGWSFREIAALLRCKEATARAHHARACARMKRLLKGGSLHLWTERAEVQAP